MQSSPGLCECERVVVSTKTVVETQKSWEIGEENNKKRSLILKNEFKVHLAVMLCLQVACLGGQVAVTDGQELLRETALDGQFAATWWSFYKITSVRN